jgi:VanZ family protein
MTRRHLALAAVWLAVAAWAALIFALSAQSTLPDLTHGLPDLQDIAGHLAAYAGLASWLALALRRTPGVRHPWRWAFVLTVLYGLSDEFHQSFVPNRHPDLFDVATDMVGAALALWFWRRRSRGRANGETEQPAPG